MTEMAICLYSLILVIWLLSSFRSRQQKAIHRARVSRSLATYMEIQGGRE